MGDNRKTTVTDLKTNINVILLVIIMQINFSYSDWLKHFEGERWLSGEGVCLLIQGS
jgi:hypothetical protein